jgi:DNA-binding GntR family transcriptional regulator
MLDPKRVTRATLATQLEDALRVDIIEGVLTPGQRLRAADLTARYGVSATPLREALQRLAAQNLVEIDPRLGATVAHISQTDLRDIYWLRELLEGLALERSIERGDDAWERRVTDSWERFKAHGNKQRTGTAEDALAWSDAHRAFHEALFAACDSPWLLRFVGTLYDHSERYRMLSVRSRLRDTLEEHAQRARGRRLAASPPLEHGREPRAGDGRRAGRFRLRRAAAGADARRRDGGELRRCTWSAHSSS